MAVALVGCSSAESAAPAPQPAPAEDTPAQSPTPSPDPAPAPAPALPAFKPTFPTVQNAGGAVVAKPRVVPIIFANDTLATQIDDFTKKLASSTFWGTVAPEYGVGALTAGKSITVQETPPATLTSTQIEQWLAGKLTGASPAFGAPDASTLYAIYYPPGVTITMDGAGDLGQSCQGFGGYHGEIAAGTGRVGYAVLPRCSGIDELTVSASHETFEWATDPLPDSAPAFARVDDDHIAWQAMMYGELGDLCTFLDRDNLAPPDLGYLVQRMWSNKLSLAGGYPCAPKKSVAYVQAVANAADDALVPAPGGHGTYLKTKAIRAAPGGSKSADVLVYSDAPLSKPVALRAMSLDEIYGKPSTSGFTYALDRSYAAAGETVKLTVNAPKNAAYDVLVMVAYLNANEANYWPVLVTNDAAPSAAVAPAGQAATSAGWFAKATRRRLRSTRLGLVRSR